MKKGTNGNKAIGVMVWVMVCTFIVLTIVALLFSGIAGGLVMGFITIICGVAVWLFYCRRDWFLTH